MYVCVMSGGKLPTNTRFVSACMMSENKQGTDELLKCDTMKSKILERHTDSVPKVGE